MLITSYFSDAGVPATGLTASIRIRNATTNALIVTDAAMTEVGDGFYKYDFAGYVSGIEYIMRADGGAGLSGADRYSCGGNDTVTDFVRDVVSGGGEQVGTQLIMYAADNVTEIARFNLIDASGNPTADMSKVVKQVRV